MDIGVRLSTQGSGESHAHVGGSLNLGSLASSKSVIIQRSNPASSSSRNSEIGESARELNLKANISANLNAGTPEHAMHLQEGVTNLVEGRSVEKKELQNLNDRFANYIDKTRLLETENTRLSQGLVDLKCQWSKNTEKIRLDYEDKLHDLRKKLNENEKSKAEIEVKMSSLEDQIIELQCLTKEATEQNDIDKDEIKHLEELLAEYQNELNILKKHVGSYDTEKDKYQKEIARYRDEIKRLRHDLDQETIKHIKAENDVMSLREELEFTKFIQNAELKEVQALSYKDTSETQNFWKNEMAQALQELESEYDRKADSVKCDMEIQYNLQLQQAKSQISTSNAELTKSKEQCDRVKSQLASARESLPQLEARNAELEYQLTNLRRTIDDMKRDYQSSTLGLHKNLTNYRVELDSVVRELQNLLNAKNSLELEIATYRKLLESEESRASASGEVTVSTTVITRTEEANAARNFMKNLVKGETIAKTKYDRHSKGDISLEECSPDGKYVEIKNKSQSERYNIGGWKIIRDIDSGTKKISYQIPDNTWLESSAPKNTLRIWAHHHKPKDAIEEHLEFHEDSWGMGSAIVSTLINKDLDEQSVHKQSTVYVKE